MSLRSIKKYAAFMLAVIFLFSAAILTSSCRQQREGYLKDIYSEYFKIGGALNSGDFTKMDDLLSHYNSVTAEYEMKWGKLESKKGTYDYSRADKFIEQAAKRNIGVRGHVLVWYRNVPDWFINMKPTKEQALSIMTEYIGNTIRHFGGASIYAWDVVNEALHTNITQEQLDSGNIYRNAVVDASQFDREAVFDWYSTCGVDFIETAFITADSVCDANGLENIKLFYNDYSLNQPLKREACIRLVSNLLDKGIRVDGIGMQAHYSLGSYLSDKKGWIKNFEESVKAFTGLGVEVHITELDIDPGVETLTEETELLQAEMYGKIFDICRKYSDPWKKGAGTVTNVTTWGIADSSGSGRKFLFANDHSKKKAFDSVTYF